VLGDWGNSKPLYKIPRLTSPFRYRLWAGKEIFPNMAGKQLARRGHYASVNKYAPYVRTAARLGKAAYNMYSKYKGSSSNGRSTARGTDESAPLYGTAFTSKVGYRSRRPNKKRARFAKKSFKTFMKNSMKLQNPQNSQGQGFLQYGTVVNDTQLWGSVDILNALALNNLVLTQLPSSVLLPPASATQLRDFRLMLKSFSLKLYFTNTNSNNVYLDLYYILPRRNVTAADIGKTTASAGNALAAHFTNQFTNGVTTDLLPDTHGTGLPDAAFLGSTPFQYTNFCRIYKITRVRNLVIPPGGTFVERATVLNREINLARLGTISPATSGGPAQLQAFHLQGLTRSILWKIRGMPTATNAAGGSSISVSWEENATSKVVQTRASSNSNANVIS